VSSAKACGASAWLCVQDTIVSVGDYCVASVEADVRLVREIALGDKSDVECEVIELR
jgi:hypothetical protein